MANIYGWGWALTSQIGKAKAYELNQHGEFTRTAAVHVLSALHGADRLASAFSISPKGFEVLLKFYFDREPVKRMLITLFDNIFAKGSFTVNHFLKRQK